MLGERGQPAGADLSRITTQAFDRAWERLVRSGVVGPFNKSRARLMLAEHLTYWVQHGEYDEWRLTRRAIFHVCYFERVIAGQVIFTETSVAS
ncbi:MAG TPA: hypothetical protein VFB45_10775 [Pseudolabrys sp.]|nr:hypothetical protein [Pseudolabrys sp.]